MSRPWKIADDLAFTGVGTTESTPRKPLLLGGVAIGSQRVKVVHADRSAGAGSVTFKIRGYSALTDGKKRIEESFTLDAAGADSQDSTGGLDILLEAGSFWTIQASATSGHGIKMSVTYGNARDF